MAQSQNNHELSQRYHSLELISQLITWYKQEGRAALSERLNTAAPEAIRKKANLSLETPMGWTAPKMMAALKETVEQHCPLSFDFQLQYCHSQYFVDILGPIHKSDGAILLCEHFGLKPTDALVVGDGMNDIDMFQQTWGQYLCPANAHPELQQLCLQKGGVVSQHAYIEASQHYLESLI